jgi:putative phosphoribosyl transferase
MTGGDAAAASVEIAVGTTGVTLDGDLRLPDDARGVVVFAHGSGSSRRSPRNVRVAGALNDAGLGTLLFDLLTPEEDAADRLDASLRFDIALLAERLVAAVDWVSGGAATSAGATSLPVGLFGASTGAAAALVAAAARSEVVRSVVSRGGRPDLARDALDAVDAPVLLLVGELDSDVLRLNEEAAARLRAEHEVSVVPGATHLFEEPGALEEVSRRALTWFVRTLQPG